MCVCECEGGSGHRSGLFEMQCDRHIYLSIVLGSAWIRVGASHLNDSNIYDTRCCPMAHWRWTGWACLLQALTCVCVCAWWHCSMSMMTDDRCTVHSTTHAGNEHSRRVTNEPTKTASATSMQNHMFIVQVILCSSSSVIIISIYNERCRSRNVYEDLLRHSLRFQTIWNMYAIRLNRRRRAYAHLNVDMNKKKMYHEKKRVLSIVGNWIWA